MSLLLSDHITELELAVDLDKLFMEYKHFIEPNLTPNNNNTHLSTFVDLQDTKFANSYLATVSHRVYQRFQFSRIAVRVLAPLSSYKWHSDEGFDCCVHLPLVSNNGCFFIFENVNYRLIPNGNAYLMHLNQQKHTFLNSGEQHRIHIIYEQ